MKKILLSLLAIGFTLSNCFAQTPDANGIIYVDINKTNGTGNSWASPTKQLADALLAAKANASIKEIWVATGTYKPMYSPQDGANFGTNRTRDNAFLLVKDVKLYGGFAPTGSPTFADRNPNLYPTVLSGDLNNSNTSDNGDNYHVIVAAGDVGVAILEGFTIKHGFAVAFTSLTVGGKPIPKEDGGAIVLYEASPSINNCIFENNIAGTHGGAISNLRSSPTIANCIFRQNDAHSGGAIYNQQNASSKIINSLFYNNISNNGIDLQNYDNNSSQPTAPEIINCTFYNTTNGAKFLNDGENVNVKIYNSILWGGGNNQISNDNSWDSNGNAITTAANNIIEGGYAGTGNINLNPLFVNAAANNFAITVNSPAKNTGNNSWFTNLHQNTKDIAGNPRVYDYQNSGVIDIGAYEYQEEPVLPVNFGTFTAAIQSNAVKLQWNTFTETNNKAFILNRSTDGKSFEQITQVDGKGTSNAANTYSYLDYKATNGINYYKLQQIDADGIINDLATTAIYFTLQNASPKAYPNPTTTQIDVSFNAGVYSKAVLYNLAEQEIESKLLNALQSSANFDLTKLPAGIYIVKLLGNHTEILKIVKQ